MSQAAEERPLAVDGIEPFGLAEAEVHETHPAHGETGFFNAGQDPSRMPGMHGVRLDDGKCSFGHIRTIVQKNSVSIYLSIDPSIYLGLVEPELKRDVHHDGNGLALERTRLETPGFDRFQRLRGEFATGMIYIAPDQENFIDAMNMVEKPLAMLGPDQTRPPKAVLDELMAGLR